MPCCLVLWPFFLFTELGSYFPACVLCMLCLLTGMSSSVHFPHPSLIQLAVYTAASGFLCSSSTPLVFLNVRVRAQLCLTLCELLPPTLPPMDFSPPGSSVHGILQARILQWVAIRFSRGSFQPRGWTLILPLPQWQVDSLPLYHLGSPHLPEAYIQNHLFILWGPLALLSVGLFWGSYQIWPWVIVIYTHFLVISLSMGPVMSDFFFHSVSTQCSLAKYQKKPHFWGGVGIFVLCQLNFSIA